MLAEEQLSQTPSATVCRKLSSIGRRVLSIESVSNIQGSYIILGIFAAQSDFLASDLCRCAFTDEQEESLEERWQHSKAKCLLKRLNSEDTTKDISESFGTNSVSRQQVAVFGNS